MSSNKTANLQLNQWAAGDAFLRTEFNEDNGKIDAAVQGAKQAAQAAVDSSPYVKLFDVVTTTDTPYISLDMTGFDWSKYHELRVYAQMCSDYSTNCYVRINGISSGYSGYSGGSVMNGGGGMLDLRLGNQPGMLRFCIPCQSRCVGAYGYAIGYSGSATPQTGAPSSSGNATVPLPNVGSLSFQSSQAMKAGAKVIVYGVKKI